VFFLILNITNNIKAQQYFLKGKYEGTAEINYDIFLALVGSGDFYNGETYFKVHTIIKHY